ncbi:hypothetical protein QBC43DRAFT_334803 [Cladorrhinum sp. PSN259]|nr:hypothetical protein QBC43DRAFT_334803 [Cladorrhinum sp. PSN259]
MAMKPSRPPVPLRDYYKAPSHRNDEDLHAFFAHPEVTRVKRFMGRRFVDGKRDFWLALYVFQEYVGDFLSDENNKHKHTAPNVDHVIRARLTRLANNPDKYEARWSGEDGGLVFTTPKEFATRFFIQCFRHMNIPAAHWGGTHPDAHEDIGWWIDRMGEALIVMHDCWLEDGTAGSTLFAGQPPAARSEAREALLEALRIIDSSGAPGSGEFSQTSRSSG